MSLLYRIADGSICRIVVTGWTCCMYVWLGSSYCLIPYLALASTFLNLFSSSSTICHHFLSEFFICLFPLPVVVSFPPYSKCCVLASLFRLSLLISFAHIMAVCALHLLSCSI